jgi:hypothetical protein
MILTIHSRRQSVSPLAFSVVGCGGAQSPAVGERESKERKREDITWTPKLRERRSGSLMTLVEGSRATQAHARLQPCIFQ